METKTETERATSESDLWVTVFGSEALVEAFRRENKEQVTRPIGPNAVAIRPMTSSIGG